jgi:hypothetical protein
MDKKMKQILDYALRASYVWLFALMLPACHEGQPKRMPDLSIKRVKVGDVQLAVKEDKSWLKEPENNLVGFRIRIDYPSDKTFTTEQNNEIDFGIQDDFSLVSGGDTLKPVFFQRIANGTRGEAEYVAAFQDGGSGGAGSSVGGAAAPVGEVVSAPAAVHCRLLFQDPLFGLGGQVINF